MRFPGSIHAAVLLSSIILFAISAHAQEVLDRKISLNIHNEDLNKVLNKIGSEANVSFSYTGSILPSDAKVSIKADNAPLKEVLDTLFNGRSLIYIVFKDKIIIRRSPAIARDNLPALLSEDAPISIRGTVTNADNKVLLGVTVIVNGGIPGTITDNEGYYSINAGAGDTLIFSCIGYKSRTVPVNGRRRINVRLERKMILWQEVVVVGYGTQKREDLTGAISSIRPEYIKDQPVAGLQQSLEGKSAGIQITQNSGSPGKNAKVRIRGLTSINNSDPLYVVDGIPLTANGINAINPSDIASVEVLKDASAQAIYGSRGANGVVLIVTKKGSEESSHIAINAYRGFQQVRKKLKMLNSEEFVQLNTEAYRNAGLSSPWQAPSQYTNTTDWQDALFRTAPIQNYDIAFSGGNNKLTYRLSGSYFNQEGIIIGSDYKRVSIRLNSAFKPVSRVEVGENISLTRNAQHLVGEGATSRINIISALKMDPTVPVKYPNGDYSTPRYSDVVNPVASIHYIFRNNSYKNWGLIGGTYLQFEPVKGLTLKTNVSIDLNFGDVKSFNPQYYVSPNQNNPITSLSRTKSLGYNWTWDNTATYETDLNGDNYIKVLAGISQEQYAYDYITAANQGQPGNDPYLQYLDAGTSNPTVGGRQTRWALLSYIGRLNYNYKETYFLTASIRRDGSSKFGENNKYGNFPSASVGWVVTREPFLHPPEWLNYLKLRGSWGVVGNQTSAGYYDFYSTINNNYYVFGSSANPVLTAEPGGLGNRDLKWEQVRQWDVGLDYRLFNNNLTGSFDYYDKKTNNMLLRIPILFQSGYANGPLTNVASMLNSGLEFSASYYQAITKDIDIDIGFNIATLHNEVLSLENKGAKINSSPNLTEEGHSAAGFYGYVFDGIFQNQQEIEGHARQPGAEPGDIRFKDLNDDGVINDRDETFIGSPIPQFTYGFHAGGNYQCFDVNFSFSGVYGNQIYQSYKYNTDGFFISNYNMEKEALMRWHGEGTSNHIPRLNASDPNNNARVSSFYLASGSYLRLRNVTIGYNFRRKALKKLNISSFRVYLSAQNLLTFTQYDGYDPEIGIEYGGNAGTLNIGEDHGNYPQPRTISAGINLIL